MFQLLKITWNTKQNNATKAGAVVGGEVGGFVGYPGDELHVFKLAIK